jgi:hypothetical protein
MSSSIEGSRHQALIDAPTEFYKLLTEICYIEPSDILYAPHGPLFNGSLGTQLGYDPEALNLLSKLPYLSEQCSRVRLKDTVFIVLRVKIICLTKISDPA